MDRFWRHIAACNTLGTARVLRPFRIGPGVVGWLAPAVAAALSVLPEFQADAAGVALAEGILTAPARTAALAGAAEHLAERGLLRLRGEAFDVRATPDGAVLATLDRGALPAFGILSQGVHVNGLVRRGQDLHLWVGWRARDKSVAPGQLDNIVAGGIPAGLSAEATLVKEAAEEAGLPAALARQARRVGRLSYAMIEPGAEPGGTRRDVLHCFDLDLPENIVPVPNDDEVERFELWPAARVLQAVRDTDTVKFNVNLVLIDLFLRERLLDPDAEAGQRLRAGLQQGP